MGKFLNGSLHLFFEATIFVLNYCCREKMALQLKAVLPENPSSTLSIHFYLELQLHDIWPSFGLHEHQLRCDPNLLTHTCTHMHTQIDLEKNPIVSLCQF